MIADQQLDNRLPLAEQERASLLFLLPVTLFLSMAFFSSSLGWDVSLRADFALAPDEAEALVTGGQASRRIVYSALGVLGMALMLMPSRHRLRYASLPFALVLAYLFVCAASLAWSDEPWLTVKRVAILVFSVVAALGIAKHLSQRDLIVVALGIGMLLLGVGFYAEVSLGSFRPWLPAYRFAGTVHPNTQGGYCAIMVLAAFFGWKGSQRHRWLYATLLLIAMVFLLLTKSRTSIAACFVGLFAAWYFGSSRPKRTLVGIGVPFLICSAVLVGLLFGLELLAGADAAVQLGRDSGAGIGTLNGRLPLWNSLTEHVMQRPLLGYGYDGFWSGERIYSISMQQGWTVPSAHSAYLEVVLGVGLLGGLLFASIIGLALQRILARYMATGASGDAFALSIMFLALVSSALESGFLQPSSFDSFVAACALFQVLLQAPSAGPARAGRGRTPAVLQPLRLDPFRTGEVA